PLRVSLVTADDAAADVRVCFDNPDWPALPTLSVVDFFLPVAISCGVAGTGSLSTRPADKPACERVLERVFGFGHFREGRFEALERALRSLDSIVLLPTGSGKSVAFQMAALLRPGACLVVDPILSLIDDQIDNLRAMGIDRTAQVSGNLSPQEREAFLELLA